MNEMTKEQEVQLLNAIGHFLTLPDNKIDASQSALHVNCVNYIVQQINKLGGEIQNPEEGDNDA